MGSVLITVDKAGGVVNARETATKKNSLFARLKTIELSDVDHVANDLENYSETDERAQKVDEKIPKANDLFNKIVYELYGVTDKKIKM